MSLTATRLGSVWKLYSGKGSLLGTLTIPHRIADQLVQRDTRHVRFVVMLERPTLASFLRGDTTTPMAVRTAIIERCWQHQDGVRLHGITPEEIERQDGFAFAPGAGYLRSLLE